MPERAIDILTDPQALTFLEQRAVTTTSLNSAQIADEWSEDTRYRAFFSARVAKADLLSEMRRRIQQVVGGEMTAGQAKEWIREFVVTDGASSMRELGWLATDFELNEANLITELGSARRISLIVDQNVRMAESVGEWQRFGEVADFFPYVRYKTREDSDVRQSHRALNNTIWRVGSPELAAIFPPNDFRCRCRVEQLTEDEVKGKAISSTVPPQDELAKSGYRFDPSVGLAGATLPGKPDRWPQSLVKKYDDDLEIVVKTQPTGLPPTGRPSKRSGILSQAKVAVIARAVGWIKKYLL